MNHKDVIITATGRHIRIVPEIGDYRERIRVLFPGEDFERFLSESRTELDFQSLSQLIESRDWVQLEDAIQRLLKRVRKNESFEGNDEKRA